jgi:hypothetical protein
VLTSRSEGPHPARIRREVETTRGRVCDGFLISQGL